MSRLQLRLAAEAASVGKARHEVAEFAEQAGVDSEAVSLAVSEVVSNAVLHAYRGADSGDVLVEAWLAGKTMIVEISDDGQGMTPNPASPGMGYGLPLVAAMTDGMGLENTPEGGTRVTLRFGATG